MKKVCLSIMTILSLFCGLSVQGQDNQAPRDTTEVWQIITTDDNEFVGTIVSETGFTVKLKTDAYGTIEIARSKIKKMEKVNKDRMIDNEYRPDHLQSTRYFWAPSGYALSKGEGYYQNVWIFFNQFSAAITENFSCGVGTIPIFLMGGDVIPLWITPKFSIPVKKDKLNLAAGAVLGGVVGEEGSFFGLTYGIATFGRKDKNISVGIGYGFTGDGWSKTPAFTVSAISRVSKKGYFLMENYIISDNEDYLILMLLGGRTVWRNVSLDYGAVMPFAKDMDSFVAIPWLGLIIPFTSKN